ncbi:hypothetical protein B0F90DRAFT_729449 [Multifurca ochricompacta]|uniref:Uncharacterized protein n=1 Tax=Multifurca ochricompacta TaxID=376703 RepID=A0AAD4QRQ4_9AGAM|nr:hypothetical protein B0F90DRAFT_729449 [Multifurca ochricompacta]
MVTTKGGHPEHRVLSIPSPPAPHQQQSAVTSSRLVLLSVRWRSWLSHLSNTQKVPGSNPGRTIIFWLATNYPLACFFLVP